MIGVVPVFFRCAFTIGDCRTPGLLLEVEGFRNFFTFSL
jgi:hypothetical protein